MYWLCNTNYNLVYFPIPKNASTTIIKWLSHDKIIDNRSFHCIGPDWKDYYKFTIVRNPYTRIISSYSQFLQMAEDCPELVAGISLDTFEDFVHSLLEIGTSFDTHVETQSSFLKLPRHHDDDFSHIDYIGKFEWLEESISRVARHCHLPSPGQLPRQNQNILGIGHKTIPEHTAETRKITCDLYSINFDMFGYAR
jgi:chondroitin 4-sulfotransferase 11